MTDTSKSEVSNSVADQIDVGPPPVRLSGGRSYKGAVAAIVLVVLGAGAAFAWLSYGDRLSELAFSAAAPGAAPSVAAGDSLSAAEFATYKQETSISLQSVAQMLGTHQVELKRLSDQLAGLTARIEALQSTPAPAAAPPAPTLAAPAPPAPVAVPRPAAPRKRPAPSAPAGGISVGGAPLPGTAPAAR